MAKEPGQSSEPPSPSSKTPTRAKTRKRRAKKTAKKAGASRATKAEERTPAAQTEDAERLYAFADQLSDAEETPEDEAEHETSESWVSFRLDQEVYALPVAVVQEILRVTEITRVPHAPPAVLGVTNRRGRVLPVIDLRARLRVRQNELSPASRIVVISSDGRLIGLLVDAVRQVEAILRSQVQPAPPESSDTSVEGVLHQDGEMVLLLDLASTLTLEVKQQAGVAE